jgi:hypothetical protein
MMIDQNFPVIELTASDRCDRCGAQAIVLAQNSETGSELLFCGHHIKEHKDKLREIGYYLTADGVQAEQAGFDHAAALV